MDALVIGAGIGGLAAALGLRRAGWRVRVLDEDHEEGEERNEGVALWPVALWPRALRALELLCPGRLREARRAAWPANSGVFDLDGRPLIRLDPLVARGVAPIVLPHTEVHRLLLHALGADQVLPAAKVIGVRETSTRVVVRRGDGVDHLTDLVVAAGGPVSALRPEVDSRPRARRLDGMRWHGVVSREQDPPEWCGEMWGRGETFGIAPLADGGFAWYAVTPPPEPGERDDLRALRERFGHWPEPVPRILAATGDNPPTARPVEVLRPLPRRYVRGRVALLGDAAHAMPPALGQEAGQALEDAAVLSLALRAEPALTEALHRYDQVRRPRANRVARLSWLAGSPHRRPRPWAVDLRDGLLAHTPQWMITTALRRLLGTSGP
ncbi:FAD-dependent monooxygenase [Streptoalloteichus hindustanus]|uniref:2-polyprenyl-6-methoxyphenol hydroxylase n=1 Tax=Streptoalloteichus hindustanus TaxID=2017 RepID=A0A1M5Q8N4_STRHI|nr:FAD-dependent monooxygenase [Streptoalloteichus hindustanus]SHH10226.1 2-polyprenyl-6-methoxyphenol hydroxylase [Streptoalloteichus hindustanus]